MIVDAHVHIAGEPKIWGKSIGPRDRWKTRDFSPEAYLQVMEENKIDQAILLPIAPYISNQYIADVVDQYPKKFIGFASVVPQTWMAPAELESAITDLGLRGLKLHPRWQGFDPADPLIIPTLKKAAELKIPVFIHCRPAHSPKFSPLAIWNMLYHLTIIEPDLAPNLTVVLNHMGSFHYRDAISWVIDQQHAEASGADIPEPRIYLGLSGSLFALAAYSCDWGPEKEGPEFIANIANRNNLYTKLIFGTDWPFLSVKDSVRAMEQMPLDDAKKDAILARNVLEILKGHP